MSDTDTCSATSDLGNRCGRVKGHDKPDNYPTTYSRKLHGRHIAYSEDGAVVQTWVSEL